MPTWQVFTSFNIERFTYISEEIQLVTQVIIPYISKVREGLKLDISVLYLS
jgi:hypothetical protein